MAHHDAAAAAAPPKKQHEERQLSAEDKHFTPEVIPWKDLNNHERKAIAHYAVGKGGCVNLRSIQLKKNSLLLF